MAEDPKAKDTILRAYRAELDPTVKQRRAMIRQAGAARWAYNWALAQWRLQYEAGSKPSWMSLHKELTQLKRQPETAWLRDVSAYVVRESLHDLGDAYSHFFRRLKQGLVGRAAGEPQFRAKNEPSGRGFRVAQPEAVDVREREVKIAGVGWVKFKRKGYIPTGANYRGLACRGVAGRWHVAVQVEQPRPAARSLEPSKRVGVEIGVRSLAVTSDGRRFGAIRDLQNLPSLDRRLALWQRRMARRHRKGIARREQSRGWHQAVTTTQKLNASIANLRRDTLHQASCRIVRASRAPTLVVRDMRIQQMIGRAGKQSRNEKRTRNAIAPMVARVGFFELRRQLAYKADWAGAKVEVAPNEYPSTRRCSVCGAVRDSEPGYPDFACGACGHREDREANSAKNLRDFVGGSSPGGSGGRTARRKTLKGAQRPAEPGSLGAGGPYDSNASGPDGVETNALGSGNRASAEQSVDGTGAPSGVTQSEGRYPPHDSPSNQRSSAEVMHGTGVSDNRHLRDEGEGGAGVTREGPGKRG